MDKRLYGIYLLILTLIVQSFIGHSINISFAQEEDVHQVIEEEIDSIPLEDEEAVKDKDDGGNQSDEGDKANNQGQSEEKVNQEEVNQEDNYKEDTEAGITDDTYSSDKEKKELDNLSDDDSLKEKKSTEILYKIKFVNNGVVELDQEKEEKLKSLGRDLAAGEDLAPFYKEANEILGGNYIWLTSDKHGSDPYTHMPEKNLTLKPTPVIKNESVNLQIELIVPENFSPEKLEIRVRRKSNNTTDDSFNESIILSKEKDWRNTLENLEKKDDLGNYYTYFIEEISENNWRLLSEVGVTVDESTGSSIKLDLRIINRPIYPPTGGSGSLPFIFIGSIIFLIGFSLKKYNYMERS